MHSYTKSITLIGHYNADKFQYQCEYNCVMYNLILGSETAPWEVSVQARANDSRTSRSSDSATRSENGINILVMPLWLKLLVANFVSK